MSIIILCEVALYFTVIFYRSIGIFTHFESPGEIQLVENCTVSTETFDLAIVREFFEDICSQVVDEQDGGQIHVFSPLAASG